MTISIGRFTGHVRGLARSGDRLRVDGLVRSGTEIETAVWMQQFTGLLGNADEPVIPVVCTERPDLDGFYRPTSGGIDELRGVTKALGRWNWGIDLERVVGGFARAAMETLILTPGRVTDHTNVFRNFAHLVGVANDLDYAVPSAGDWGVIGEGTPMPSADGNLVMLYKRLTLPSVSTSYIFRTYVRPDRFYRGAATIEVLRDGTWYTVVGRQLPSGTTRWRISNGLFRLSMSTTLGRVTCEIYDPDIDAYTSVGELRRGLDPAGSFTEVDFGTVELSGGSAYVDPVILRNDPATVVVRVPKWAGSSETYRLQSGRWGAEIDIVHYAGVPADLSLEFGSAGTALSAFSTSYGIQRSSADANGNRWFLASATNVTEDTTNGGITLSSPAERMQAFVGAYGSTSSRPDADASISAYLLGTSLKQMVVAR